MLHHPTMTRASLPRHGLTARSGPHEICGALRRRFPNALLLDGPGAGAEEAGWGGPLVALDPRPVLAHRRAGAAAAADPLLALERLVRRRRAEGGGADTGLAALLAYDLLDPAPRARRDDDGLPELVVLDVDVSLRFDGRRATLSARPAPTPRRQRLLELARELLREPARLAPPPPARPAERPLTSLPRRHYVDAVERVRRHIRRGDLYQANLTQRFCVRGAGDRFELYRALAAAAPAPRSAFFETGTFALASASPESFLRVGPDGAIETRPIKGTRPRGAHPDEDGRLARELERSPKDRAELTMIVDLERNDLGRVCEPGSVEVPEPGALRSYSAVHHLVARVQGVLRAGVGTAELLQATFPGGSITGAPKRRVMEVLRRLEPVRRGFYTGSLMWFGDDGSIESSILIRTVVAAGERAFLGAGGGVVADSDPEAEWREANDKARAAAGVLGFVPEDAC